MRRRRFVLLPLVWGLGCGSPDPPPVSLEPAADPIETPSVVVEEAAEAPPAPPSLRAAPEATAPPFIASPETPVPPLADLLRLPGSARDAAPAPERTDSEPDDAPISADASPAKEAKTNRIGVDFQTRTDGSVAQPERNRSQTDASLSVDVDESTRVRAGVRVEQQAGEERERPIPTVGIEKRF